MNLQLYHVVTDMTGATGMRIICATGMRRSEVSHLRWDWIDQSAETITLPADLTKNGRSHIVLVRRWASEVLVSIGIEC
nr:tyrosine-type recombinase/integrase [Antarctobacter heliothermus]